MGSLPCLTWGISALRPSGLWHPRIGTGRLAARLRYCSGKVWRRCRSRWNSFRPSMADETQIKVAVIFADLCHLFDFASGIFLLFVPRADPNPPLFLPQRHHLEMIVDRL